MKHANEKGTAHGPEYVRYCGVAPRLQDVPARSTGEYRVDRRLATGLSVRGYHVFHDCRLLIPCSCRADCRR